MDAISDLVKGYLKGGSMKYEPMTWYGWNGGECPVHPNTRVRVAYIDAGLGSMDEDTTAAKHFKWDSSSEPIVAFQVVGEYKEPREFWVFTNGHGDLCVSTTWRSGSIHVREVTDEDN